MISTSPTSEVDELARNVIFLAEANNVSLSLFSYFVKKEVNEADSASNLFRANSFCTKMFKFYSKMHGLKFIFSTLASAIAELEHEIKENNMHMEVDPNKMEEGEDTLTNKVFFFLHILFFLFGF